MINKDLSQKGSAHAIIIIVLVLALLGTLGFVFWQNFIYKEPVTKKPVNSSNTKEQPQVKDKYAGWKTYTSTRDGYSIKYPSEWILISEKDNDGPYIRNFDPSSRPPEDKANNKNYPKDYINLRVLKNEANDAKFTGSTATEWYEKLGNSTVSDGPVAYTPDIVANYELNGMSAKKAKSVFSETNENIFILKNGILYTISLYPYGASDDETVKKMLDSFTYL